jgi:hypothetical protein
MRLSSFALSALFSIALGCNKQSDPIESRSPVRGSVKVAGKPAAGLVVRFHLEPGTADERAPKLVEALTDAGGAFRVSQNAPDDGLAPGKYVVTFFWPPGGDAEAPASADQLKGRYSNPEKSQFRIEVQSRSNELPPFELK